MHCVEYSLKFQSLNNYNLKKFVYTIMNVYHPSPQNPIPFAYAHLPLQGEKFCTWEKTKILRSYTVGVLLYGATA